MILVGLAERMVLLLFGRDAKKVSTPCEASTSALSRTIGGRNFSDVLNGYLWLEDP